MNRIGKNIKKARSEKGYTQEQSADQTWRKEILKRVIWLVIAGLIIMISASLIQYGGEIAKDTLQVPMWSPWLEFRSVSDCIYDHWQSDYGIGFAGMWKKKFRISLDKSSVPDSCCSNPYLDEWQLLYHAHGLNM